LGFLDFDKNARVAYSKLDTALTSGDADDYAKIILTAPNKPVVDIEISSIDAYSGYNLKIQGTKGTFKATPAAYEMTYIVDGENPERPVIEQFLKDENGNPVYCSEKLEKHVEAEKFDGTAFDVGTASLYSQLYFKITEGTPMTVTPEMAADIISIIETVHAQNPLPLKY
jgi:predicted dehydrogenase